MEDIRAMSGDILQVPLRIFNFGKEVMMASLAALTDMAIPAA